MKGIFTSRLNSPNTHNVNLIFFLFFAATAFLTKAEIKKKKTRPVSGWQHHKCYESVIDCAPLASRNQFVSPNYVPAGEGFIGALAVVNKREKEFVTRAGVIFEDLNFCLLS